MSHKIQQYWLFLVKVPVPTAKGDWCARAVPTNAFGGSCHSPSASEACELVPPPTPENEPGKDHRFDCVGCGAKVYVTTMKYDRPYAGDITGKVLLLWQDEAGKNDWVEGDPL